MRIVCPSCDAVYDVPDAMLASGPRAVRCVRCGTEWSPAPAADRAPAADEAPPPPVVGDAPERLARVQPRLVSYRSRGEPPPLRVDDVDARPPPRDEDFARRRRGALVGWVLSVLLLTSLAIEAVAWRTQVMAAWPPSQRLYTALGLR